MTWSGQHQLIPAWDRCREEIVKDTACEDGPAEGCCATMPCSVCVKVEYPSDDPEAYEPEYAYASAERSGASYSTQITVPGYGTFDVLLEWSRNPYTDDCELKLYWDDEEVASGAICDYESPVSCREPGFEEVGVELDYETEGLLSVIPSQVVPLAHHVERSRVCPSLDIAFVTPNYTGSIVDSTYSDLLTVLPTIKAAIDDDIDDYRMALATYAGGTSSTEVSFSDDNYSDLTSTITGLSRVATADQTSMPDALDDARAFNWRSGAIKIVVAVLRETPIGAGELDAIEASVQALRDDGILVVLADVPNLSNIAVATDSEFTASIAGIANATMGLFTGQCELGPPCKSNFCNQCSCVSRKLCVKVEGPNCGEFIVVDVLEDCDPGPGTNSPQWEYELTCGDETFSGSVAILRDEYTGDCVLQVELSGDDVYEDIIEQEISDCGNISVSYDVERDYEDFTVTITSSACGECEAELPNPCCGPGFSLPRTLNASITVYDIEGGPQDTVSGTIEYNAGIGVTGVDHPASTSTEVYFFGEVGLSPCQCCAGSVSDEDKRLALSISIDNIDCIRAAIYERIDGEWSVIQAMQFLLTELPISEDTADPDYRYHRVGTCDPFFAKFGFNIPDDQTRVNMCGGAYVEVGA